MYPLSIPSPSESVWMIGPLPLRAYAIAIIIGIVIAWWLLERRYQAKGGPAEVSLDIAVWMIGFGIVGARLYHVVTTPGPYFGENGDLSKILRVWEGGLGIWGAIALGAVGAWIGLKRRGLRMAPFADALAPGLLIGQAVGRLGNYFNQELYGRPTELPWGLEIDPENIVGGFPEGTTFHPTFLYELVWCLAGAVLLVALERRYNLRGGQSFWLYVMIYTAGRTWIENLRIDEAQIVAGLRLNVWTSIAMFLIATGFFIWRTRIVRADGFVDEIYDDTHTADGERDSHDAGPEAASGARSEDAAADASNED
ncbi:prolipoprotein diacylglyceryl transferase [Flaviflexus equikiangi]|uniref:Phosphatidylglycerol--prolipoprotein diacylglyceryl transferase n=1 Tax=Flaviflexus equikiangi TaxID=2758573 RepID=A0ABS2THE3_9ACTO|nr:prolipoprotein diacylglyceryl transferase [Flaviflexus equikiangi]MBM9434076.1 prolipoprotein diacylglyceryl transferase [Flaviflexus equikiangi]